VAGGIGRERRREWRMGLRLEGGRGERKGAGAAVAGEIGAAWICRGTTRRERRGEGRKGDG
jgi:hypothetical protein